MSLETGPNQKKSIKKPFLGPFFFFLSTYFKSRSGSTYLTINRSVEMNNEAQKKKVAAMAACIASTMAAVGVAITACSVVIAAERIAMLPWREDGRRNPLPRSKKFSSKLSQFEEAENDPLMHEAWHVKKFRCSKISFDTIVAMVENEWENVHGA